MSKFSSKTCGYIHKFRDFSKKDEQDKASIKGEHKKVHLIRIICGTHLRPNLSEFMWNQNEPIMKRWI